MGISNSNFATINATHLNPAKTTDPQNNFELQMLGLNFFAKNNYAFVPKEVFKITNPTNISIADDFKESGVYNGHLEFDLIGPSFTKALYEYGFGISTRFRGYVNVHNLPSHVAKFLQEGFAYDEQHDEPYAAGDFMIKSMSWGEVNFNFSRIAYQFNQHLLTAGLTLKRLIGYHNAGFYFKDVNYEVVDNDVDVFLLNGTYALTTPTAFGAGRGWGFDLGFEYKKTIKPVNNYKPFSTKSSCEKRKYDYRIGLSILDIGGIKFNTNARYREITDANGTWANYQNTNLTSWGGIDGEIISRFDPDEVQLSDEYRASLPTSVAIEIDKRFRDIFFFNATGLYGFRLRENQGVARLGFFSVTPRVELPKYEAAMPITLYNFKSPAVGLMLRYSGFYLGTNNFLPYFFNVNVWGADFYLGFKYTIPTNKECKPAIRDINNWWCPSCND